MYRKRRSSIGIPKTCLPSFFSPPTNKDNPASNCEEFISPFLNLAFNDSPTRIRFPNMSSSFKGISTISGSSAQFASVSNAPLPPIKYAKITGRKLYFNQFQTLLLKRFHHTKRNWKVFLSHILLPLLFVAMSMGFTLVRPSQIFQRQWLLTPAMYDQSAMFVK
jgi:hypothetical protein